MPNVGQEVAPRYGLIEYAERLQDYTPGGLHPVSIGDQLRSRYRIVHKLGYGTFSTTWLAHDTQRAAYVAVKIARADSPTDEIDILCTLNKAQMKILGQDFEGLIRPILDTFIVEGPNGRHSCFVTEPAACSLSDSKGGGDGGLFRLEVARAIAAQLARAVELVHSCGFVHGDLHLGNVLLRSPQCLDELSSEEIYQKYGAPQYDAVLRTDGLPLSAGVPTRIPQMLWMGISCRNLELADARIVLADFGASFAPSHESESFHAPTIVRPPDARFESAPATYSSDIWTLGCSLWDLLAWRSPFESFFGDQDETTFEQADALGHFPTTWWQKWETRTEFFTDQGTPTKGRKPWPLEQRFEENIQELRSKKGWPVVNPEERAAFLAMIRSMLTYLPQDRPTIHEVLQSEWMQKWALPEHEKLKKGQVES